MAAKEAPRGESGGRIALFDLDGTLADYEGRMRRDLRRIASPGEPEFALHDRGAPRYFGARLDLVKAQPGWWCALPRLALGFEILALARQLGFQIEVLTTGPHNTPSAWMEKVQWARRHVGREVKVTVTEDKSLSYGSVLIDDTPRYLVDWLARHPDGRGVAPAQPANEGFDDPRVVRYDGGNLEAVRDAMLAAG